MKPAPLIDASDESQFGGKAASLARALRAGLPVPHGFALTASDVESVFNGAAEVLSALRREFTALAAPCAVRSSAIGEDSEVASFAGQHLTVLNVRHADQIAEAVLQVRQSAHSDSARAYRRSVGADETTRIGVVVQRMIDPDCAGVMFTRNPINGRDGRVIEASWGLGEAVVGGLVIPDHYELDAHGTVLTRTAGEKDMALRGSPDGGTIEEPLEGDLVTAFCLTDGMLATLHDLAGRCESHFGKGLDIEWGFAAGTLYLLQCRPITRDR